MAARGPQIGRWGLERCLPLDFGHYHQLLINKYFDPTAPSMRKGRDKEKKKNTSLAALGTFSHRLQRRTMGPKNGQWCLERCLPLGFWALTSTLGK